MSIDEEIYVKSLLEEHGNVIFSKFKCPFSQKAESLFYEHHVKYFRFELESHEKGPAIQEALARLTYQETAPYIFINREFVGGAKEVQSLSQKGLLSVLAEGRDVKSLKLDLVVIGGGPAGIAVAIESAKLGAQVALCDWFVGENGERRGLGGHSNSMGSTVKKLLHRASIIAEDIKDGPFFGWHIEKPDKHDWPTLVDGLVRHINALSWDYRKTLREAGVSVFNAQGVIEDEHSVKITDRDGHVKVLKTKNIVIAAGSRAKTLDIRGAKGCAILSDYLYSTLDPPGKTLIIGSDVDGIEIASGLSNLGYASTVLVRRKILPRLDADFVDKIKKRMEAQGVKFVYNVTITNMYTNGDVVTVNGIVSAEGNEPTNASDEEDEFASRVRKYEAKRKPKEPKEEKEEDETEPKEKSASPKPTKRGKSPGKKGKKKGKRKGEKEKSREKSEEKEVDETDGKVDKKKKEEPIKSDDEKGEKSGDETDQKNPDDKADQKKPDEKTGQKNPDDKADQKKPDEKTGQKNSDEKADQKKTDEKTGQKNSDEKADQKKPDEKTGQKNSDEKADQKKPDEKSGQKNPDDKADQKKPDEKSGQKNPDDKADQKKPNEKTGQKKMGDKGERKDDEEQGKPNKEQGEGDGSNQDSTEVDETYFEDFSTVIIAVGRRPNTDRIGLDKLPRIELEPTNCRINVNDVDQTAVSNIFAVGSITNTSSIPCPAASKRAGQLLARRLFKSSTVKMDYMHLPRWILAPVEYAYIGETEEVARKLHGHICVYHNFFTKIESGLSNRIDCRSYAKFLCTRVPNVGDKIVGLHILAPHAGEILQGFVAAFKNNLTKEQLSLMVAVSPTMAEVFADLTTSKESGKDVNMKPF